MVARLAAGISNASLFLPIRATWRRERVLFLIFCGANILVGQCGVIWPLLVAWWQDRFVKTLDQNLQSANFAVFAVSLLVGACTLFAAELIEAPPEKKVELVGYKVMDAFLAFGLILFQALLTGHLVQMSFAATSTSVGPTALSAVLSGTGVFQLSLWAASMILAIHIFSLSRMHRYEEELAEMRRRQLAKSNRAAKSLEETSDHEKL